MDADTWLDVLGRPDPAAWARVDEALVELSHDAPVRLAIERERVRDAEARCRATPELAWAAERARYEPYAFDRLVIEHARQRTMATPDESRAALDACVQLFGRRVERGDRAAPHETTRALLALARAYVADDERAKGHHIEAGHELDRAWSLLAEPTDPFHREIRATLHEVRVDLANMSGDHRVARQHLAEATLLLRDTVIPARRVATLWRAGRTDVAIDRDARAVRNFEAALRELPEGLADPLRLDVLHLLAFAEAVLGHHDRAADYLDRARPLLIEWGHILIMAQRGHLLGHLARIEKRYEDAADHWRASVALAVEVGRQADALQTLVALRGLESHGVVGRRELGRLMRRVMGCGSSVRESRPRPQ